MHYEALIAHYGYIILVVSMLLTTMVVAILGGLAAHVGYLNLYWATATIFVSNLIFTEVYFYIGRRGSTRLLRKHPDWNDKIARIEHMIEHYNIWFVLLYRFMVGLRVVTPFVVGTTKVTWLHFLITNTIGCLVWSIFCVVLGYYFGAAVELMLKDVQHYEKYAAAVIVVLAVLYWALHIYLKKRRMRMQ